MNRVIVLIVLVAAGFVAYKYAPPMTKGMYLSQYEAFVKDVETNFRDYDASTWETKNAKFKQLSRDYFEKFEDDLTEAEREQIAAYKLQYLAFKMKGKARGLLDDIEDAILDF